MTKRQLIQEQLIEALYERAQLVANYISEASVTQLLLLYESLAPDISKILRKGLKDKSLSDQLRYVENLILKTKARLGRHSHRLYTAEREIGPEYHSKFFKLTFDHQGKAEDALKKLYAIRRGILKKSKINAKEPRFVEVGPDGRRHEISPADLARRGSRQTRFPPWHEIEQERKALINLKQAKRKE